METITPTPPEQGQTAVLRSGGVVGLRAESAEALAHEWSMRAKQLIYEADTMTISQPREAKEMHGEAQIWAKAADELRRQMATETMRQPELTGAKRPV